MDLRIEQIGEDRRDEWWAVQETVFAFELKDEEKEPFAATQDWDRAWGAFDGDQMVGSAASLPLAVTVPGGASVPTAGLTAVSVLPTHRRRGVLTGMVETSFADARENGEPLAALLASETPIYGRYGYGIGTREADLTIDRRTVELRHVPETPGRVRLIDADEAKSVVPGIHRDSTAGRGIPGAIVRTEPMWAVYFMDPEHWRNGASRRMWAIYEAADGTPRGYARYRVKEKWEQGLPSYKLIVINMHAVDGEAHAALHSYLLGIDLVSEIKLYARALSDPVFEMVADPRRVKTVLRDGLWVRFIDLPAALEARRYRVEDRIVLEVSDEACPWNAGRFALEGGPDGASCSPTDAEPDLIIGTADLASAYLGAGRLAAQAWAGRVLGDPGAIRRADLMLSWGIEPWNTVMF